MDKVASCRASVRIMIFIRDKSFFRYFLMIMLPCMLSFSYQWCWLDEGHTEWEHCCMPGAQCKSTTNENGHTFDACTSCKDITRSKMLHVIKTSTVPGLSINLNYIHLFTQIAAEIVTTRDALRKTTRATRLP